MTISKRHHYIPEFFIKGFTDNDGMLWVYDKKYDKILKDRKSPKGIFFENDINSISVNGKSIDLIEQAYSKIDNKYARKINKIRDSLCLDEVENIENICYLETFIMFLFWRNISNDKIIDKLIPSLSKNENHLEVLKNFKFMDYLSESDLYKIEKSFLPFTLSLKSNQQLYQKKENFSKILHFENSFLFFLSDNPIVFSKLPINIEDVMGQILFFPLSSKRIYLGLSGNKYVFSQEHMFRLNLLMINQAERYVGSSNKDHLNSFINVYKDLRKNEDIFVELKEKLIREVNHDS